MLENLKNKKDTQRNENQVNLIKRALTDFKNKIKNMSKYEIEIEQLNDIKILLKKFLSLINKFNKDKD